MGSLSTSTASAPISVARRIPAYKASYFSLLLVVWKSNLNAYVTSSPIMLFNTNHAQDSSLFEAPSVCRVQYATSSSTGRFYATSSLIVCCILSAVGNSTKKSARAHAFKLDVGLYSMSCSPRSIAHLASRPDFSGLDRIWWMG